MDALADATHALELDSKLADGYKEKGCVFSCVQTPCLVSLYSAFGVRLFLCISSLDWHVVLNVHEPTI